MRNAGRHAWNKHRHLITYVSAHGFGHVGQTAPVAQKLMQRMSGLRLTVVSGVPASKLRERFGPDASILSGDLDVGMRQLNALEVDRQDSWNAYVDFHESWDDRLAREVERLRELKPDLVLANIPYLPLAAAKRAGIPAVAMCSLDWVNIFGHYYGSAGPQAAAILDVMLSAYRSAIYFLRLEPALAMPHLDNTITIAPVAESGTNRRAEIIGKIGLRGDEVLVMVSLGGMEFRPPVDEWPEAIGAQLIVPASWKVEHPDVIAFEELDMPFIDALASCDVLVAKPGYGSFVEAARHGLPVLYVERRNWPESDDIISWMTDNGVCARLEPALLNSGRILNPILALLARPKRSVEIPSGADEAAAFLADCLEGRQPLAERRNQL